METCGCAHTLPLALLCAAVFLLPFLDQCTAQIQWRKGARYSRQCSQSCAGGVRRRQVVCATPNFAIYPDSVCISSGPKPNYYSPCNRHDCPPSVQKGAWSPCRQCFRNRTLDCVVVGKDYYRRPADPGLCNLTASSMETGLCSSSLCPVSWQRFPCCHERAGVTCVLDDTAVEVPDWICDKFTLVLDLTYPVSNVCPDASCFNGTLPTSYSNQSAAILEEFTDATRNVSTSSPGEKSTADQTSIAVSVKPGFLSLCLCIFLALVASQL